MYLYWYQWVILIAGIDIAGAMISSIYKRTHDIYQQRHTDWDEHWSYLLWPIGLVVMAPYLIIENSSQFVAKYMEYKRKKKLHITNKVA